jgi:HK97 family phage prohead protease
MEKKEFIVFESKVSKAESNGDTGYLEGFCSIFGNVDQGRDVVHPGAFSKTIAEKKGVVPFLLDHDVTKPAGYSTQMQETEKGLQYSAELKLIDPVVRQRYELAKMSLKLDSPMGNSFGYYAVKYDYEEIESENGPMMVRNLREVKLYEASLVTFGMNDAAGVTGAKSKNPLQVLASLKTGGYTLSQIEEALAYLEEKTRAAKQVTDPELLQSVKALNEIIRR